ncbi:hypothetical protein AVEN_45636-1 [Araneus ventricosus]|uniref:Uncharacterized protein n=1 Tax=Araneus ventricosus TaxID=182803 RepID=A0A4Y2EUX4_ARAVE|nr:hypothetical protein AVEN_45636-1 [Araneus ventricosus]
MEVRELLVVKIGNMWKCDNCWWWEREMYGSARTVGGGNGKCVEVRELLVAEMGNVWNSARTTGGEIGKLWKCRPLGGTGMRMKNCEVRMGHVWCARMCENEMCGSARTLVRK